MFSDIIKKTPSYIAQKELFEQPLVYTNFVTTTDGSYLPAPSIEKLKAVIDSKLNEYNEKNFIIDLVLENKVFIVLLLLLATIK